MFKVACSYPPHCSPKKPANQGVCTVRGDAFHWNQDTGKVILVNFGSGLRTFEHGLTSTGWSSLSQEIGAKTKLSYMSPEQTGRMPAEPDSRTDIYSLGILLWTMLTQQVAFEGQTPMDIIQGVLGRRLPSVSSIRIDVPDGTSPKSCPARAHTPSPFFLTKQLFPFLAAANSNRSYRKDYPENDSQAT